MTTANAGPVLVTGGHGFIGTGDERRDWLHVHDAVRLIEAAVTRTFSAVPVVDGGTGRSIKVRDALAQLRGQRQRPRSLFPARRARAIRRVTKPTRHAPARSTGYPRRHSATDWPTTSRGPAVV